MTQHKKIAAFILAVATAFALTACTKSLTFKVETGDEVKITFEQKNGMKIKQNDSGNGVSIIDKEGNAVIDATLSAWTLAESEEKLASYGLKMTGRNDTTVFFTGDPGDGSTGGRFMELSDKTTVMLSEYSDDAETAYKQLTFEVDDNTISAMQIANDKISGSISDVAEDAIGEFNDKNEETTEKASKEDSESSSGSPTAVSGNDFTFHDITVTVPEGAVGREVSSNELRVAIGDSLIYMLYNEGTKDMTDGAASITKWVESNGGTVEYALDTTISDIPMGVATYKNNGTTYKGYLFTVNKNIYAVYSSDIDALGDLMVSLKAK